MKIVNPLIVKIRDDVCDFDTFIRLDRISLMTGVQECGNYFDFVIRYNSGSMLPFSYNNRSEAQKEFERVFNLWNEYIAKAYSPVFFHCGSATFTPNEK